MIEIQKRTHFIKRAAFKIADPEKNCAGHFIFVPQKLTNILICNAFIICIYRYSMIYYFLFSGIFKQPVQLKEMVCTKAWTGCQTNWPNRRYILCEKFHSDDCKKIHHFIRSFFIEFSFEWDGCFPLPFLFNEILLPFKKSCRDKIWQRSYSTWGFHFFKLYNYCFLNCSVLKNQIVGPSTLHGFLVKDIPNYVTRFCHG